MKNWKILSVAILLITLAWGCSTDVEINAPYKPYTVVFGLLDPGLDTQFVKINKTWLGEGNNFDFATIRDSSEYNFDEFVATVGKYNGDNLVQEWELDTITKADKSTDGIFFGPEYTAYFFVPEDGLDQSEDIEYRLFIDFDDKEDVRGTSNVVDYPENNSNVSQPPPGVDNFSVNLATVVGDNTVYGSSTFKWNSSPNSGRYEVSLDFHYIERVWEDVGHTTLVSETPKTLNWFVGSVTAPTSGISALQKEVAWEAFYRMLENRLEEDPLVSREIGWWNADSQRLEVFDMVLSIANDQLSIYMDVNEPVTGIIQERPEYTNIINGLGLFASRGQQRVTALKVTNGSIQEMVEGQFTLYLNFCSGNPFDDYSCN